MSNALSKAVAVLRVIGMLAMVGLLTVIGRHLPINAITARFAYLLAILVIATFCTLFEAIAASLAASLCLNFYFLPPLFRFSIDDPQDLAAFVVFLATAVSVSKLSSIAKLQTEAALGRSREMERLYTLSRAVLLNTSAESTARDAAVQIARIFDFTSVSLLERSTKKIYRAGAVDLPEWDNSLRLAALNGTFFEDLPTRTVATSVRLGADVIGSLVLRGQALSDSALQSLANLVAIALERARMLEATNAADLIRKSEELKSTLLDAIAHEFKTPLTSVKAAASALRSGVADPASRQELILIIDEESDRLERLVTDAIQMARIEAGRFRLELQPTEIADIVASVVASMASAIDGRAIHQAAAAGLVAEVDPKLVQLALKQVLDNALKYSSPGSSITIAATELDGNVLITVDNEGPGIPEAEQRRIFDRYYRSSETKGRVPGTGIGLAIAKDIMLAHGGEIWAKSKPGDSTTISLQIPLTHKETC